MINLSSIWQILVAFEIALFLSYTLIMYIFSKKKVELPKDDPPRRCPDIGKANDLLGW